MPLKGMVLMIFLFFSENTMRHLPKCVAKPFLWFISKQSRAFISKPSGREFSSIPNPIQWLTLQQTRYKQKQFLLSRTFRSVYQDSVCPCYTTEKKHHKLFHTTTNVSSKALTIWKDVKELRSSPLPALTLGIAGLVPFAAAPVYMLIHSVYMPVVSTAQIAYGACILAFLGTVRWGITLPEESNIPPDWINLGYSVVPSLIAWTGLLMPPTAGILTLIGGLGLAAYLDLTMYGYPPWFKGLRFLLTFVAIVALWSSFMCLMILPTENQNSDSAPKELQA